MYENEDREWPDEVTERLQAYADRVGISLDEALEEFIAYLANDFGIDDWTVEEDDRLIDLSEGFFMETRRKGASSSSTVEYVGHFIGISAKWSDRRESNRTKLAKAYTQNPDAVLEHGAVGVFRAKDGQWVMEGKNGVVETGEAVVEGALPRNAFRFGDSVLGLLVQSAESSNYGKPYPAYDEVRYLYFLGNQKGHFEDEIRMLRVAAKPDDVVTLGVPCKFNGKPIREDAKEGWDDVVEVWDDWSSAISYTDEFVDPDLRRDLRADQFWTNGDFHEHYVGLDELAEAYEAGKQALSNGEGHFGPIVITKGFVARMSTEPQTAEWDQTGKNYSMDISSMSLQQAFGDERAEVRCWISGALGELGHPFEFNDGSGWAEYAERSTVLLCGRIGLQVRGDKYVPKLNVLGIHAIPNRARRRQSGGDTGLGQFD